MPPSWANVPRLVRLAFLDVVAFANLRRELWPSSPAHVIPLDVEHVLLTWRKRFKLPHGHGSLLREVFSRQPRLADFRPRWALERAVLADRPD